MSLNTAELGIDAHDQRSQTGTSWSSIILAKLSLGLTSCIQEISCILFFWRQISQAAGSDAAGCLMGQVELAKCELSAGLTILSKSP